MRCYKCKSVIPDDSLNCPYCLENLNNNMPNSGKIGRIKFNGTESQKVFLTIFLIIFGLIFGYQIISGALTIFLIVSTSLISLGILTANELFLIIFIILSVVLLIMIILLSRNIVSWKIKKRKVSTIIYSIVTAIIVILLSLLIFVAKPHFPNFKNEEYIVVNNIEIPTINKFTEYDKKANAISFDKIEKDKFVYNVTLIYIDPIPAEYISIYANNLIDLGYEEIYDFEENRFYVKRNIKNNQNIIIGIFNNEIEYNVVSNNYLSEIFEDEYNRL